MPQISANFRQLTELDPVLREVFFLQYQAIPERGSAFIGELTSSKGAEFDLRVGSFGDPEDFDLVGQVPYDEAQADYQITYRHKKYSKGFTITQDMLDDNQYSGILDRAANMGTAFSRFVQKQQASILNNAFTAAATAGYDSVALCSASHPRSQSDATTVSNTNTLALNSANLETAIQAMSALGDDRGEEISIMPNLLIVPRGLRKTAFELTQSELTPESAENAANVHRGLQFMTWEYLTDSNNWFLVDTTLAKRFMKWYWRKRPVFDAENDFDKDARKFRGLTRFSFGWSDWRWIYGSNPG